jgi:hypothetical protein
VPLREMPWNDQLGLKPEPEAWLDAAMAPR